MQNELEVIKTLKGPTSVEMGALTSEDLQTTQLSTLLTATETVESSKFSDNTKLSGTADTPEGWDAIQKDLHKLKKWAHKNLLRFNKAKFTVLHLGQGNPWCQYRMDGR
ncbi:hypothetical protein DUI87_16776 [Hirundo rustica rustica]|uniref:Rna-directed dna polymerase from mobile element jockey-like n=1 Tax=Hirundo rustica rustica TaxID=333673 RepID=A0A3M0K2Q8_HIRRU|nr:hypothetical protein DUI87_16776 [Hirundo rustica rustica]